MGARCGSEGNANPSVLERQQSIAQCIPAFSSCSFLGSSLGYSKFFFPEWPEGWGKHKKSHSIKKAWQSSKQQRSFRSGCLLLLCRDLHCVCKCLGYVDARTETVLPLLQSTTLGMVCLPYCLLQFICFQDQPFNLWHLLYGSWPFLCFRSIRRRLNCWVENVIPVRPSLKMLANWKGCAGNLLWTMQGWMRDSYSLCLCMLKFFMCIFRSFNKIRLDQLDFLEWTKQ